MQGAVQHNGSMVKSPLRGGQPCSSR